ncbi:MAG: ribosome biogenesis GTPase RsgA, partial [Sinobacterium sp.]
MAKRKLNRRQSWRIQKVQDERNKRAERRDAKADETLNSTDLGAEQLGLVIAHYGTQVDIETLEGSNAGIVQRAHIRANVDALVTGDKVVWRPGNPTGVVVAMQERESILQRPDSRGLLRPVAANINFLVITFAPEPTPYANLIDRYLV